MHCLAIVSCTLGTALGFYPVRVPRNWPSRTTAAAAVVKDPSNIVGAKGLYPPSEAHTNGTLRVFDNGTIQHEIYYEVHGNPRANLTALFLHGGPGAGCFPNHARFFDPQQYKIILMDQRGAGRSKPRGEIVGNTLQDIISDCESVRCHLGIATWSTILGGSWGVTVAVAYAQEHPEAIQSVILRGVCLFRAEEVDWMFSNAGYAQENIAAWNNFSKAVMDDDGEERDVLGRYYDRLLGDKPLVRLQAAKAWMQYEMSVFASSRSTANDTMEAPVATLTEFGWSYQALDGSPYNESLRLDKGYPEDCAKAVRELQKPLPLTKSVGRDQIESIREVSPTSSGLVVAETMTEADAAAIIPAQNMLTCFYSTNREYVMNGVNLLDPARMKRIQHIPCTAVHGARDRVCPVNSALDLAACWPKMELRIPMLSGHSMYDVANTNELIRATDKIAQRSLTSKAALVCTITVG